MEYKLVIAEKPSVAISIAKVIGAKRPCGSILLLHGRFSVVPLEEGRLKFACLGKPLSPPL